MWDWISEHPEVLAAGSTVLLAFFAAVQIGLEFFRRRDRRCIARIKARGPAWLARRSCEAAYHIAGEQDHPYTWVQGVRSSEGLDRLERQMLETLRLTSEAGGDAAAIGSRAFSSFLAYADRLNWLAAYQYTSTRGGPWPIAQDMKRIRPVCREALEYLRETIIHLEKLAPRQPHESEVGGVDSLRVLELTAAERRATASVEEQDNSTS